MIKIANFSYQLPSGDLITEEDLFAPFTIYYKDSSQTVYILDHPSDLKSERYVLLANKEDVVKYSLKSIPKDIKEFLLSLDEESKKIRKINKIQCNDIDFQIKNKLIDYLLIACVEVNNNQTTNN